MRQKKNEQAQNLPEMQIIHIKARTLQPASQAGRLQIYQS